MEIDETINHTPKIGISSCLLGQEVRYDGGHKHNRYVTRTLGQHFEFVPHCPELAIGLGTPRAPIRLFGDGGQVRAVGVDDSALDFTSRLATDGDALAARSSGLSGYILKKDSPSCGMERVEVYSREIPEKRGVGIFASRLMAMLPDLPVEEEGRLMDPGLRENFVERVFTYHRWQRLLAEGLTAERLVAFHTRHKFFILAHDEPVYRELGRLVASAGKGDIDEVGRAYVSLMMQGLREQATPRKHANVLMHIMGFFKDALEPGDKQELVDLIDAHRNGLVPVIVPITLLNHFLRKFPNDYVMGQVYLSPHPRELMLRNHI